MTGETRRDPLKDHLRGPQMPNLAGQFTTTCLSFFQTLESRTSSMHAMVLPPRTPNASD